MIWRLFVSLAWLATALASGSGWAPPHVTVQNGITMDGRHVGVYTSGLQSILDALPDPSSSAMAAPHVDESVLRYVTLVGDYFADAPLKLPSYLVLELKGSLRPAKNLTVPTDAKGQPSPTPMVQMENIVFSAAIGGLYNLTGRAGVQAIHLEDGRSCAIRGVRAVGAGESSAAAIELRKGQSHEVSFSEVSHTLQRCIWLIVAHRAVIHDNYIHHCGMHSVDFDAYTSYSTAYNNVAEDNVQEGIFVEETANHNVIVNNTCRRNFNGIGVYSNAVGPVSNNFIIGNIVTDNKGGISAGGYGHNPAKHSDGNLFASNVATGNGYAWNPAHGAVIGDVWTANTATGSAIWKAFPDSNKNASIFEPQPVPAAPMIV